MVPMVLFAWKQCQGELTVANLGTGMVGHLVFRWGTGEDSRWCLPDAKGDRSRVFW